ncbi:hypothetical protein QOL99_00130 [Deinococcus sp. MIMF12]|uniref:DUF4198 domain-containing protein n=1 Tax=Deinococcus rhizophilus TaxID=3049544 RepID=A0ABT7JBX4_9DEIO|nr:hypothetical protein [Deinococcus rhizophilus]MDL2342555.1 hypothetical protein [Deinococcus rhizophilus]
MSLIRIHIAPAGLLPGESEWLDAELLDYDAPFDLQAAPVEGGRAVDSVVVRHTGDRLPTSYAYTATGYLYGRSDTELDALYWRVKRQLAHADQIWRGERYLKVGGATLAGGEPLRGQTVVPAPIVCQVTELRWYRANGTPLHNGASGTNPVAPPAPPPPPAATTFTLTLTLTGPALAPVTVTNLTTGQQVFGAQIGGTSSIPGLTGGHTYRVSGGAVNGWTPPPDRTLTLTANTTLSLTYTQAAPPPPPPPPDTGYY